VKQAIKWETKLYDHFTTGDCAKAVENDGRWPGWHQCSRRAWKDGWCRQHHPETVHARQEKASRDFAEKVRRKAKRRNVSGARALLRWMWSTGRDPDVARKLEKIIFDWEQDDNE
jgi:hypothetical protein